MTTIAALNVRLGMDARNFAQGTDLARNEVNKVSRILRQSEPPAEKFRKEMELLDKTFNETGKQTKEYASAVEFLRQKHGQVPQAIKPTRKELEFLAAAEKQAARDNQFMAQVIERSTPAIEKYRTDLQRLNALWPASQRGTQQYARAVDHLRQKHGVMTPVVNKAKTGILGLNESMLAAVPGGHMLTQALSGPIGKSLALAAALAAVTRSIGQAADRIDTMAKKARSLGILSSELAGMRLAAAEFTGMASGQLDTALRRMTRRIAEAAQGTGEAKNAIKELGLDAAALNEAGPAEAFKQIADQVRNIEGSGNRLRIAFKLFDSEGAELVTTLMQGGDAIGRMQAEAERLGVAISAEAEQSVEAMNDAWGRTGSAVQGIWNQITVSLAPTLTNVAKLVEQILVAIQNWGPSATDTFRTVESTLFVINKMVDGFRLIVALLIDAGKMAQGVQEFLRGGEAPDFQLPETNRLLDEMDQRARGVQTAVAGVVTEADKLAAETEAAAKESERLAESYDDRIRQIGLERLKLEGNTEEAERLRLTLVDGFTEAQAKEIMMHERRNEALREQIKRQEELQAAAKKDAEEREKQAKEEIERARKEFEKSLSQSLKDAEAFFESERKEAADRRSKVAEGPGSGMEVGGSEAVRFMADQFNARIGAAAVPERPTPGEEQIARKAAALLAEQKSAGQRQERQTSILRDILKEQQQNKIARLR